MKSSTKNDHKNLDQNLMAGNGTVRKRMLSARSRSRSRSPSVTPERINVAARAQVCRLVSNTAESDTDPVLAEEPKLWYPPPRSETVSKVNSPRGTKHLETMVEHQQTLRGTHGKYVPIEGEQLPHESYLLDIMERAEALGLDESEGEDALEDDKIRKWVDIAPSPKHVVDVIPSSSGSMAVGTCSDVARKSSPVASTSSCSKASCGDQPVQVATNHGDVLPSVSGTTATSTRYAAGGDASGSEYDSDYDDEFDPDVIVNAGGMARGVPDDDELDERDRSIINRMERAMDDALDVLIGESSVFDWQADYDRFMGVPEQFSGPTPGPIRDYDTPYEAFVDIWDTEFMGHIVLETNRYAKQVIEEKRSTGTLKRSSRQHQWRDTDVDEMYRFFAVLILMGIDSRTSQHEYWESSGYLQMPFFRQLLSYDRFILLSKFLHFTDNSDVSQNLSSSDGVVLSSKLRKLAPVILHLNFKFQNLYHLRKEIAIDESLTLFKGRLSWVQAIKSKAARFGIKSYELCESLTGYLHKFYIYTGKNSERDNAVHSSVDLADKSTQVVLGLLKGLERRGHLVTMDNFYNSPALARHLKGLGFDCLGTLRVNRKNIPQDIAKIPKNVRKGTIVARHSGDVSCIAWMDTRLVTMISTYHNAETYVGRKAGKELIKPLAVRDYNITMGGVDLKDQKLSMYLLERKRCLKWYIKIFKRLLNISVHNAFIMLTASLKKREKPYLSHRVFRKNLADSLLRAHKPLPSPQKNAAPFHEDTRLNKSLHHCPITVVNKSRKRCLICQRNDKTVTSRIYCDVCTTFLCTGDCWRIWHYCAQLPGREVYARPTNQKAIGPVQVPRQRRKPL